MTTSFTLRGAILSMSLGLSGAVAPMTAQAATSPMVDATASELFGVTELGRRGRGADDGPGHIRGGKGADDAPGDDRGRRRGGHGADDGPGHTWNIQKQDMELARRGRGADDAPGDDRGGRGRGKDDGAGHA